MLVCRKTDFEFLALRPFSLSKLALIDEDDDDDDDEEDVEEDEKMIFFKKIFFSIFKKYFEIIFISIGAL